MAYKWGIDLGGTKIEGVILDSENNNTVVARLRLPTEQKKGYEHILGQIHRVVSLLSSETGLHPERIGMGTPGILDPSTGLMKNSNTQCLLNRPLQIDVQNATGVPFRMSNDANCFAMAETKIGVVKELDFKPNVVFGVIMGTGVGGGVVINGEIINGLHGIGGEWGHNELDPNGYPCYCGKKGCVEQVIAGPSLERHYKRLTGKELGMKEIAENHRGGKDADATATIQFMVSNFGKAIATIINVLDPEVIILGGGVGNVVELSEGAAAAATPYVFNNIVKTKFLRPKLGDSAGVFGAALLV